MPSVRKNMHKFVRNLSNPAIENGHHKRGNFLRRTICTESAEQYQSRPNSAALDPVLADDGEEEDASFILRYLRGEIQRIHPRIQSSRSGDFSDVHILAPLDTEVCICSTGPDEGISLVPYLGSRKIYDKPAGSDYYSSLPPEAEEKLRHMPAMLRAAHFAKSGQQCYFPRSDFQALVSRSARIDGTRNRPVQAATEVAGREVLPSPDQEPSQKDSLLSVRRTSNGTSISKSGSLISVTHIGTAPHALIEELLEEDEDMTTESVEHVSNMVVATDGVLPVISVGKTSDSPNYSETTKKPEIRDVQKLPSSALVNGVTEHGDEMVPDSYAEVLPVKTQPPLALFSQATKRRLSKSIRGKVGRSIHQQLLEDFPFSLESNVQWDNHDHERACGVSTTLYERHPLNGQVAGNPVADVFAICARGNNAILAIADGVNWGEKARLAAQCAVRGAVDCLQAVIFQDNRCFRTSKDVFTVLLDSVHAAHNLILQEHGALSTLCIAVVCPLQEARSYVTCVCNVGDSFAYVYSRKFGVREITGGSHNIQNMRDMRDALGALGPVDGCYPELSNIMCSMTVVEADDIVFLTTDGISDNFDPVIGKFCLAENEESLTKQIIKNGHDAAGSVERKDAVKSRLEDDGVPVTLDLPKVSAAQRHELTLLRMEDLIRNGITLGDKPCSNAREVCQCFINFATQLTSAKRHVLEDPDLYPAETAEKQSKTQQRHHRRRACERLALMPGKLDHATLVAYQVGEWNDPPSPDTDDTTRLPVISRPSSQNTDADRPENGVVVPKTGQANHAFPLIDSSDVTHRMSAAADVSEELSPSH